MEHGRQGILLAVALHLTFNIVNTILIPVTIHVDAFVIFVLLEWIAAILLIPHLEAKAF